MRARLALLLDRLRSSFWAVPGSLVLGAMVLALILVRWPLDDLLADTPYLRFWWQDISPEGAQSLLGVVATSVLTLAGVTFSVTIVALTLASSQFGPRLLRNFIRSRATQMALGLLLAAHAYCLVVLRHVQVGESPYVPQVAVHAAFLFAVLSLGVFIYFIHHVAISIQAERVVVDVYHELCRAIERFGGGERSHDQDEEEEDRSAEREVWEETDEEQVVRGASSGYVQALDVPGLVQQGADQDLSCRVLVMPGHFVVPGQALIAVTAAKPLAEETRSALRGCVLIGAMRTAEQDMEFCLRQLVEIALRALSPGINDPYTAINCIDYLGSAMVLVADQKLPRHEFTDSDDEVRVRVRPHTFESLLGVACHQIRQASAGRIDVPLSLLTMLTAVGGQCRTDPQRRAVAEQADLVAGLAESQATTDSDAEAIRNAHAALQDVPGFTPRR